MPLCRPVGRSGDGVEETGVAVGVDRAVTAVAAEGGAGVGAVNMLLLPVGWCSPAGGCVGGGWTVSAGLGRSGQVSSEWVVTGYVCICVCMHLHGTVYAI